MHVREWFSVGIIPVLYENDKPILHAIATELLINSSKELKFEEKKNKIKTKSNDLNTATGIRELCS